MSIKAILFDLDGTLLPMNQDLYIKEYFVALVRRLTMKGYSPEKAKAAVWAGTEAMLANDGRQTNEELFWRVFISHIGDGSAKEDGFLDEFYRTDYQKIKSTTKANPEAKRLIEWIKELGLRIILATNPVFPSVATESRIAWAGLSADDFELYTTYENMRFSKPNPAYYLEICDLCGLKPEECLMVGNDARDDMIASTVGMSVFLLTDCLINTEKMDISGYKQGGFPELFRYISEIASYER